MCEVPSNVLIQGRSFDIRGPLSRVSAHVRWYGYRSFCPFQIMDAIMSHFISSAYACRGLDPPHEQSQPFDRNLRFMIGQSAQAHGLLPKTRDPEIGRFSCG